jgi:hypothetical protein
LGVALSATRRYAPAASCRGRRDEDCTPSQVTICVGFHRSGSACIVSWIAMKLGRPVSWDVAAERFVNDPHADEMLARRERAPYGVQRFLQAANFTAFAASNIRNQMHSLRNVGNSAATYHVINWKSH